MPHFIIGLGSNIEPKENIARIIEELLDVSPRIHLSRILETEAVGIKDAPSFLNLSVSIYSDQNMSELKKIFNEIETKLGRDRNAGKRKVSNRTADIDILFSFDASANQVNSASLPQEPYFRPVVVELLNFMKIDCEQTMLQMKPGVPIEINGAILGNEPVTLKKDSVSEKIHIEKRFEDHSA